MKTIKAIIILALALGNYYMMAQETTVPNLLRDQLEKTEKHVYVIEREVPGAGNLSSDELKAISKTSCNVLDEIGEANIKWLHSYVTGDKIYCIYEAKNEALVKEHAMKGGFPANSVTEVKAIIDPSTADLN